MFRNVLVLFVLLIPSLAGAQRLPGTVIPHHYDLFFRPNLETFTFAGTAGIDVAINEPTSSILMHALELEIHDASIVSGGQTFRAEVTARPGDEMIELKLPGIVQPGPARVEMTFTGIHNDQLRGFYRGEFASGKPYVATQLQSTSARQMFPSFDEPAMKSTFRISAEIDPAHVVISNSRTISDTTTADGRRLVQFATTPRMSTYLVAMVVGEFATIDDELDGIPLRIVSSPDKIAMGRYAMDATKRILAWMLDYYAVPFPFDKLDQIAIPDFQAGAMENSGAIIYRETALLIDDQTASEDSRRYVASVIAHEIAHQWFGDLVTMQWWDDVWLNEGFASFMEDKPLEQMRPDWDVPTRVVAGMSWALNSDSLPSSRAIRSRAETAAEIDQMFDGISYSKGAALLMMTEAWIGEDAFRDGIRRYLRRHSWRNTSSADFAAALAEASELPVDRVINDFVSLPGIPLVSVSTVCEGDQTVVRLAQRRFVADPAAMSAGKETDWTIPVCLEGSSGRTCVLLDEPEGVVTLEGCGSVWANDRGRGYFVTRYEPEAVAAFAGVDRERLDPAERLVLLRDAWLQVRADVLGLDQYLSLVAAFRDERHRAVVSEILTRMETIDEQLVGDADRAAWASWTRSWLSPLAAELGWRSANGESSETRSLRAAVRKAMSRAGDSDADRRIAREMADTWLRDAAGIDPEMAGTVLNAAARNGDPALFERFTRAARESANPSHRSALQGARTQFTSPALHRRVLEETLTDAIRVQDVRRTLTLMLGNPSAQDTTWDFIRSRWNELAARLPGPDLAGVLAGTATFCSEERLRELDEQMEAHPVPEASRYIRQVRERIQSCIDLRERQSPRIHSWLSAQQ